MSKRKTPGERIACEIDPEGTIAAALWRKKIAAKIDRAIRRAQAEAWDEGWDAYEDWGYRNGSNVNPYRGRRK